MRTTTTTRRTRARLRSWRHAVGLAVAASVLGTAAPAASPDAALASPVAPQQATGGYQDIGVIDFGRHNVSGAIELERGPDGAMWFVEGTHQFYTFSVGRLTSADDLERFSLPSAGFDLAAGPDGNVWVAEEAHVTRISPAGVATHFPLTPHPSGVPNPAREIIAGPDANVWYVRDYGQIGKVTPSGSITEYPVEIGAETTIGLGADGSIWFGGGPSSRFGRITTSGSVTYVPNPIDSVRSIVGTPDGDVWLSGQTGSPFRVPAVARIDAEGDVELAPTPSDYVTDLAVVEDGSIWGAGPAGVGAFRHDGTVDVRTPRTSYALADGGDGYVWHTTEWPTGLAKVSTGPDPSGEFTGLTPARVLDTRTGVGQGGSVAPLGAGGSISVQMTGRGGVPASGVSAVVANVTAVSPTAGSYLTAWPSGVARPTISNLNFVPGQVAPNLVTVAVGAGGRVDLFNALGQVHVVVDVVGYYADRDGPFGARFTPVGPERVLDTRSGTGGVPARALSSGQDLDLQVTGRAGVPASGVTGVVMNVTATEPTASGYLTVHPGDGPVPLASNLNFVPGDTVPNLVTVRVPASGIVSFYNAAGSTHVVADVVGYYGEPSGGNDQGRFIPVVPTRLWDSRTDVPAGPGETWVVPVIDGAPEIASLVGTQAVALNVTVTQPTAAGYVTVFSDDLCEVPLASNLNFRPGQTIPNMVITSIGGWFGTCGSWPGSVDFYNAVGTTHTIFDVFGYFRS